MKEALNLAFLEWENHQHEGELEHDGLFIVREERFMMSVCMAHCFPHCLLFSWRVEFLAEIKVCLSRSKTVFRETRGKKNK